MVRTWPCLGKAAAYNAVASADAQKEVANHPLPAQPTLTQLKTWILTFVSDNGIRGNLIAQTAGLWGNLAHYSEAIGFLLTLCRSSWFGGALSHGEPLPGPLASLYFPLPGGRNGE
jgi:hypothetical protein